MEIHKGAFIWSCGAIQRRRAKPRPGVGRHVPESKSLCLRSTCQRQVVRETAGIMPNLKKCTQLTHQAFVGLASLQHEDSDDFCSKPCCFSDTSPQVISASHLTANYCHCRGSCTTTHSAVVLCYSSTQHLSNATIMQVRE